MRIRSTLIRLSIGFAVLVLPILSAGCDGSSLAGAGSGGEGTSGGGSVTFYGTVKDDRGQPLQDATVTLDGDVVATTDTGGGFGFTEVTIGSHKLQATGFSMQTATESVSITQADDDNTVIVITLHDAGPIPQILQDQWEWVYSGGSYIDNISAIATHNGHLAARHDTNTGSCWEYADSGAIYDDADAFFNDSQCAPAYLVYIPATLTAGSTSTISADCDGGTHSGTVSVVGREAVTVPYDTYDDAWHLKYDFGSGATEDDWLAPGIGLVKRQNASNTLELSGFWNN